MQSGIRYLVITLILGGWTPFLLHAQHAEIEQAYEEGILSLDQKILYQFSAGTQPSTLPGNYQKADVGTIKCGTPALMEYHRHRSELSASTVTQMESMLTASDRQTLETYLSASGRFQINYDTSGEDAVPLQDANNNGTPDYVEWVAQAADSSYRHEAQTLGYSDPVPDPNNPYQIYFEDMGFYGYTQEQNGTTVIVLHSNYENFPDNDDPQGNQRGAIRATTAHELKHAIQHIATGWNGETDLWAEMDATLMEEVVYDEVNDYYNYLADPGSIFSDPGGSFYPGSYYHVSWALFFEENYGPQFWPSVWEIIRSNPDITMVDAMSQQLGSRTAFEEAYVQSQLWHYATGSSRSANDFGFEERRNYPAAPTEFNDSFYSEDMKNPYPGDPQSLEGFSANYYTINPPAESSGQVGIEFSASGSESGMGIIAYFTDGSVDHKWLIGSNNDPQLLETGWNWSDISSIGLVFANDKTQRSTQEATVQLGSLNYDTFTVYQNYPNPFPETTTIRFILDEASHIKLKIYDTSGRLVQTLIDGELEAGPYEKSFDGSDLASGIYLYQLIADQEVIVKKMTLIK